MQSVKFIRKSLLALILCLIPALIYAQQGRGIFFSAYGRQSPHSFGNFNLLHAFYFEIPVNESKPVYLRIFDADVGGQYDEKHEAFNTKTEFTILGGSSAGRIYGTLSNTSGDSSAYLKSDVLFDHIYGEDKDADGNWITFTQLDLSKGFDTGSGYKRFVLLVRGLNGDDGNYFDLALSYSRTKKEAPSDTKSYVYDMSLVSPSLLVYRWKSFHGQIKLNTGGKPKIFIHTYDLDSVPDSISLPFHPAMPLKPSGDGVWSVSEVDIPDYKDVTSVGFNFFGRDFNNTFGLYYTDAKGHPLPIYLPIPDYKPARKPDITYTSQIDKNDCRKVHLRLQINNGVDFRNVEARWIIDDDTLSGSDVTAELDTTGYHPYTLLVSGKLNGGLRHLSYRDSVYVNKPPTAWAGGNRVFVPGRFIAFDGTVSEDPDGHITRYLWDFGDGTTGHGARIDHIFKTAGKYMVTLHVFDNSGSPCGERTASVRVWINKPPVARITAPERVQENRPFWLDGTSSSDPDGKIVQYEWHIGKDSVSYGARLRYTANHPGDLPVTLIVKDDAQTLNSDDEVKTVIHVNYPPVAVISAIHQVVSPDLANHFSAENSKDPDGKISTYTWDFGDGTTAKGPQVDHAWSKPGDYEMILHVSDNTGNATGTDSMLVHVNAPPTPEIGGRAMVTHGLVTLSAAGSHDADGKIIHYHWDFGDGSTSDAIKVKHKYRNTGKYDVKLTVTDNSNTQSAVQSTEKEIIVNAPPVAKFDAPGSAAPDQSVTFDASASRDPDGRIVKYAWDFGDGHTDSGKVVHHQFVLPGTYQVQLALTDNTRLKESMGYRYREVVVNHAPVLRSDVPSLAVPGSEIPVDLGNSYDPDGHIQAYYWFENGKWIKGPARKMVTVSNGTTQTVKVAVTDDSGQLNNRTEGTVTFGINHAPEIITENSIKTDDRDIVFDASGSRDPDLDSLKYSWDFGDSTGGKGAITDHRYSHAGRYEAVLSVDDGHHLSNSVRTDSISVYINSAPVVSLRLPERAASGDTVHFSSEGSHDPDGNALAYTWDFGDGTSSNQPDPVHDYAKAGLYMVLLKLNDGEGLTNSIMSASKGITVIDPPVAVAGDDRIVDVDEPVRFNGDRSSVWDNSISSYLWDYGDGTRGSGVHPVHSYKKSGDYEVTLKVAADSIGSTVQTSSDKIRIKVLPAVHARFHLPRIIRTGTALYLDPSQSVFPQHTLQSIRWVIGSKDTLTWKGGPVTRNDTGRMIRKWTFSESDSLNKSLTVRQPVDSLPVSRLCLTPGQYPVTLSLLTTSPAGTHRAEAVRFIRVVSGPVLAVNKPGILAPGQPGHFAVTGKGLNELSNGRWTFGDGGSANGLFVFHTYNRSGHYGIEFKGNDALTGDQDAFVIRDSVYVNEPVHPVITVHGTTMAGDTLTLDAVRDPQKGVKTIRYDWIFGDGSRASGPTVRHVFDREGNYQVKLMTNDGLDAENSGQVMTKDIHISKKPVLKLDLPDYACQDSTIELEAAIRPRLTGKSFQWRINNRVIGPSAAAAYRFGTPGRYHIEAMYVFGNGDTARAEKIITIPAPVRIHGLVPDTIGIGAANDFAIFDAGQSLQPDGDPLNFTWDFGDGTGAIGVIVNHKYTKPGTYTVTLKVADMLHKGCGIKEKNYHITVSNE